ncbi:hypothetical protein Cabys_4165 [Caldithrix abyssi DSM 13497]|uniref:Uncharacterized protein n=1 Tax=Caldithrix abyssi DSM 13497 TaxID=880073 RepID=A0A1J1CEB3_CALAY|nr:hypothetical protein Cabys_4165 [Caldithrix abyssi DSM 13497]
MIVLLKSKSLLKIEEELPLNKLNQVNPSILLIKVQISEL